jgi:FKBP-type peptidyl-prolyl cis-trans isomerases 2
MRRISVLAVCLCLGGYLTGVAYAAEGEKMAIQKGSKVAFQYKLTVDEAVIDSSREGAPLLYTQGQGEIIPGLEKRLRVCMPESRRP